jgi:RNA ligase
MKGIHSIEDLQALVVAGETDWKQYGEVNTQEEGDLILFDYAVTAQFMNRWNFFEQISRGLVLHRKTGEILARPLPKFFNWGQRTNDSAIVEATEKMDGSLGILLRHEGQTRVITRGSFKSDQARWATAYLNQHHDLSDLDPDLTLMWEIIYPANRVVVDYKGFEGLVLIAARSRSTGRDLYYRELEILADKYGFHLPKVYQFSYIGDVLMAAKDLSANEEGWVLRFANGERLKVKGSAYIVAHKLLTQVTFARVLEAVQAGALEQMLEGVPDEFLHDIRNWQQEIELAIELTQLEVEKAFAAAPRSSRKEFALWVQREHPKLARYLFARIDDKPLLPLIYKHAFEYRKDAHKPRVQAEG